MIPNQTWVSLKILIQDALMGRVGQKEEDAFIKMVTVLSALKGSNGSHPMAFFNTSQTP
jgi:hypothetical protein